MNDRLEKLIGQKPLELPEDIITTFNSKSDSKRR